MFNNDLVKAQAYLVEQGYSAAQKKQSKETREGVICVSLNSQRTFGVMTEVNCQTDFVARTELFQNFVEAFTQSLVSAETKVEAKDAADPLKLKTILQS